MARLQMQSCCCKHVSAPQLMLFNTLDTLSRHCLDHNYIDSGQVNLDVTRGRENLCGMQLSVNDSIEAIRITLAAFDPHSRSCREMQRRNIRTIVT